MTSVPLRWQTTGFGGKLRCHWSELESLTECLVKESEYYSLFSLLQILLQLGTDSAGSELRSRMQSASLLSDMESFKAANPGGTLADFVRWHSPRDGANDTFLLKNRIQIINCFSDFLEVPQHHF